MIGCKARLIASAGVTNGGAASFTGETNSGMFDGITRNGAGDVTLTLTEPCDTDKHIYLATPRGATARIVQVVPADDSVQVLSFDAAGAAADANFYLEIIRSRG